MRSQSTALRLTIEEEAIRAFLPRLDELVGEGPVVVEPVEVIRYAGRPGLPSGSAP